MVLAPQLQQSLALLQAPTLELKALVEQELQQNPVLEEVPSQEVNLDEKSSNDDSDMAPASDLAELLGRVDQGAVVTGRIRARKQQLRIGTAFLDAFLQRISQRDIQQPVRCLNGSRTSALGNRFRRKQSFHDGIECSVAWLGEVFGGTAQRLAEKQ